MLDIDHPHMLGLYLYSSLDAQLASSIPCVPKITTLASVFDAAGGVKWDMVG